MDINDAIDPHPENKMRRFPRNSLFRGLLIVLAIIVAVVLVVFLTRQGENKAAEEARKAEIRSNLTEYIRISHNDYRWDAMGGISNLVITVENTTEYRIDRVEVTVEYYKTVGELYKKETLYMENIPPHGVSSAKAPDSDRGTSVKLIQGTIKSGELEL
jgi:hypothetical protein